MLATWAYGIAKAQTDYQHEVEYQPAGEGTQPHADGEPEASGILTGGEFAHDSLAGGMAFHH